MFRRSALIWVGLLLAVAAGARDGLDDWISRTELPETLAETSVTLHDRDGAMLRVFPVENGRWRLAPGDVDPLYRNMLIRFEDKRFYSHSGVDPVALLRAAGQAIRHGRAVSGGSTLTMQVARLLEDSGTGRWRGKLRQMRVALALERKLDKDRILELYFTHAPFGGSLEGVEAATLAWFGKPARRLSPAQAALLVALPQAPENRRPDRHFQQAIHARNRIIDRMEQVGVLNAEAAASARREQVPEKMHAFPRLAPHLADRVRSSEPAVRRHDLTLDARLQENLEKLTGEAVRGGDPRLSAAILVADHRTGKVLASVGSAGYAGGDGRGGFVDMTRALRSPGSTLKPLVYGMAFDEGLAHPETLIHDGPASFGRYAPQNFDGRFHGDLRLRETLQMSLNIPAVKLADALGPVRIMDALGRSGARPELPGGSPGLAVVLGGVGMTLWDLVQLYAGLGQQGRAVSLHTMPGGEPEQGHRIMSEVAAWHVGDILAGVVPPPGISTRGIAWKTGTSYGHRDAWAVGYDGSHVVGVWMGRPDGTPVPGAFGGELAAPVLFRAFSRLKPEPDPLPPPPPATLILSTADLPAPLRRFRDQREVFANDGKAPELTFPPEGARLSGDRLTLKLSGGRAPFSVLADGYPVASDQRRRSFEIPAPGPGFTTLVVLDADGRSDRVTVRLD